MMAPFGELIERIRGEVREVEGVVQRALRAWLKAENSSPEQKFYLDSMALNLPWSDPTWLPTRLPALSTQFISFTLFISLCKVSTFSANSDIVLLCSCTTLVST